MPDLLSHFLIGLIFAELFNVKKKSLVVFGAIAPDLLSKVYLILFYLGIPQYLSFTSLHTPVMLFLFSILITPFFRYSSLKLAILFNLGMILHIISDMSIKHFSDVGVRLFFPFSFDKNHYSFGLIWPEQSLYLAMGLVIVYIGISIFKTGKSHRK